MTVQTGINGFKAIDALTDAEEDFLEAIDDDHAEDLVDDDAVIDEEE